MVRTNGSTGYALPGTAVDIFETRRKDNTRKRRGEATDEQQQQEREKKKKFGEHGRERSHLCKKHIRFCS